MNLADFRVILDRVDNRKIRPYAGVGVRTVLINFFIYERNKSRTPEYLATLLSSFGRTVSVDYVTKILRKGYPSVFIDDMDCAGEWRLNENYRDLVLDEMGI